MCAVRTSPSEDDRPVLDCDTNYVATEVGQCRIFIFEPVYHDLSRSSDFILYADSLCLSFSFLFITLDGVLKI